MPKLRLLCRPDWSMFKLQRNLTHKSIKFKVPYFTVRPAKFKILFELKSASSIWTMRNIRYLTNRVVSSVRAVSYGTSFLYARAWATNPSVKKSVRNKQYGPRTRLVSKPYLFSSFANSSFQRVALTKWEIFMEIINCPHWPIA